MTGGKGEREAESGARSATFWPIVALVVENKKAIRLVCTREDKSMMDGRGGLGICSTGRRRRRANLQGWIVGESWRG